MRWLFQALPYQNPHPSNGTFLMTHQHGSLIARACNFAYSCASAVAFSCRSWAAKMHLQPSICNKMKEPTGSKPMNSLDMTFSSFAFSAANCSTLILNFQSIPIDWVLVLGLNLQGGNHHLRYPYCFHRALEGLLVLISSLSDLLCQVKRAQNDTPYC